MQGNPFWVGGDGQEDLRAIRTMVAAVSISTELERPFALKIYAAQIIENQANPFGKGVLIEALFQSHPLAGPHPGFLRPPAGNQLRKTRRSRAWQIPLL